MSPGIIKYLLDPSGKSPTNLVTDETHTMVNRQVRMVVPEHGAFFVESLRVVEAASGNLLQNGVHYYPAQMYDVLTARYGKEICASFVVTDPTISDQVSIQYQALGGEYSISSNAVTDAVTSLDLDDKPLAWKDIIDRPREFPPVNHHLHDVRDVYGMEAIVRAGTDVQKSILNQNQAAHTAIRQYVNSKVEVTPNVIDGVRASVDSITTVAMSELQAHVDAPDPHPQYRLRSEYSGNALNRVKTPTNTAPAQGATNVGPTDVVFTASAFYAMYGVAQAAAEFRLSQNAGCSAPYAFDTTVHGAVTSFTYSAAKLKSKTLYYWQVRYQDAEGNWSDWSTPTSFTSTEYGVLTPSLVAPVDGRISNNGTPTLTGSDFVLVGPYSDNHVSTDWEIWSGPNGTGSLVWYSYGANGANLMSVTVPATSPLPDKATYYPRVRYNTNSLGSSAWSPAISFIVDIPPYPTVIGQAFGGGYYAGDIALSDGTYGIIVAPKATGEVSMELSTSSLETYIADSATDSIGNTAALTPAGGAAQWAQNLVIDTFTDWVLPAQQVMQVIQNNLLPSATSAPVFMSGNSEAFDPTSYWTSTTYEWVEDQSYTDPDTPIYQTTTKNFTAYGGPGATPVCGTSPWNTPSSYVDGSFQDGTTTSSWLCETQVTEIVGYQPGTYHPVYVDHYDAYEYVFGSSKGSNYVSRSVAFLARAIRLVKKPA